MNAERQAVIERYVVNAKRAYAEGRFWETAQIMELAINLGLDQAEHHYLYALALSKNPKWRKRAEEEFQKALKGAPSNMEYHVGLVAFYRRSGTLLRAERALQDALQAFPYPGSERKIRALLELSSHSEELDDLPHALVVSIHPDGERFGEILRSFGCKVKMARNYGEAESHLRFNGKETGILFLSVNLPEKEIRELLRLARAARRGDPVVGIGLVEGADVLRQMERAGTCGLMGFTTATAHRGVFRNLAARLRGIFRESRHAA